MKTKPCPTHSDSNHRSPARLYTKTHKQPPQKTPPNHLFLQQHPKLPPIPPPIHIFHPTPNILLHIPPPTTHIPLISIPHILTPSSIKIPPHKFHLQILNYIKKHYNLFIPHPTPDHINIQLPTLFP
ncbi:rod shape-determining protein, partial [Bacillus altitudinis]|uniref:rod shape-determining protein n=1 Tax=Bacillus altitudinis TaxID=293387 RepID=UPI003B5228F7